MSLSILVLHRDAGNDATLTSDPGLKSGSLCRGRCSIFLSPPYQFQRQLIMCTLRRASTTDMHAATSSPLGVQILFV